MKPKFYSFLIFSIFIMLAGCKTAGKLYQKGDYDAAVNLAVKELQKKPGDPEKISLVKNAYQFAIRDHESKIRNYHSGSNELKWEWIYNEYAVLQNLYNAIMRSPGIFEVILPKDYGEDVITFREKAGDIRVERANRWMKQQDKPGAKNAYREFKAALRLKPGDLGIEKMLAEAYAAAATRVVILPVDQFGSMISTYNYELQHFSDDLIRNMKYNSNNEFVRFYSSWDARSQDIDPDHVIEMDFNNLNMGKINDRKSVRELTKEVVIKEIVYKPDSIVKEYGKVKARVTTTRRTLNADSFLRVRITDNNGRYLWSDNINGSYKWTTEFSSYTGDERALSELDKQLVNRTPPSSPSENEIFGVIKNNMFNDLLHRLKNFYSRY